MKRVSDLDNVGVIMELENGQIVIETIQDWNRVKILAKSLAESQGLYGRLYRGMYELEAGGELTLPMVM